MNSISEKIKKLRHEKKWSQETTAKKLNVTRGKLGHWETGRTEPKLEEVVKIAELFNCDVDYLLCNDISDDIQNGNKDLELTTNNESKELSKDEYLNYLINYISYSEVLKTILKKEEILNESDKFTDEEFKKLMQFIKINKQFIIKDKDKSNND